MPLPLIKICIVGIRTFSRPFNKVLTRRLRESAIKRECDFFHWWGIKSYQLDNLIEEYMTDTK